MPRWIHAQLTDAIRTFRASLTVELLVSLSLCQQVLRFFGTLNDLQSIADRPFTLPFTNKLSWVYTEVYTAKFGGLKFAVFRWKPLVGGFLPNVSEIQVETSKLEASHLQVLHGNSRPMNPIQVQQQWLGRSRCLKFGVGEIRVWNKILVELVASAFGDIGKIQGKPALTS